MKKEILIIVSSLAVFFVLFFALQNDKVYQHSLGLISKNWENTDDRRLVKKPYDKLSNTQFIQWDAVHYQNIKNNGYSIEKAGGDYIFAFFPLFPLVWKISMLPPLGILFLNYSFFAIGILILLRLFAEKASQRNLLILSLSLPGLIIFLIPYSEALFFLLISIGIYGFIKNKYLLFFAGLFLASLTRPTYSFLGLSILATEIFFLTEHRNLKRMFKNTMLRVLPLLLGTIFVSCIQLAYHSESFFKFIEVQKYWDNVLSIPQKLGDWSHESFGMNIGVLFLLFIPCLFILFKLFFKRLATLRKTVPSDKNYSDKKFYAIILSLIYILGASFFVFLFRGGSLHGLFRFTICTPFMYILLFGAFPYLKKISQKRRFWMSSLFTLLGILTLTLAPYSARWNFSDTGFFVLTLCLYLWLFQDRNLTRQWRIVLYVNLFFNLLWTTYLLNTYISNGWIFA